ncbi:MAG: peptidylprolyl isomerase [bacterium]|nr:peptidylprolyl isomerase [bacterium]
MDLRLPPAALLSAALLFASTALAQSETPAAKPPAVAEESQASQGQDPEKQDPSSGDVITQLREKKAQLQREIEYARERAKNANKMLANKLARQPQSIKSIDAGTKTPPRPKAAPVQKARTFTPGELQSHGADTMMLVDGIAVKQAEFEGLMNYMRSLANTGTDAMRSQRILFELIRTYAVAAAFPDSNAKQRATSVADQMKNGADVFELVESNSAVLGAQPDGTITVTRNSFLGTSLEKAAFELKEGETSAPFRNVFGFCVLQATKIEKGAKPELDRIIAKGVQVRYVDDQNRLNMAQGNASRGQVEVVARDDKVLEMLPAMYRPNPVAPVKPADPRTTLTNQLQIIKKRMAEIAKRNDPNSKAELETLQNQAIEIQKAIGKLPKEGMIDMESVPGKVAPGKVAPGKAAPIKVEPGKVIPAKGKAPINEGDVKSADLPGKKL